MSSTTSGQASFASPVRVQSAELSTVAEWLSAGEQVFALLDACGEPLIPAKVVELDSRACSLFRGAAERDYTHIAPYVAHVDQELAQWIIERLGDTPWGYFVRTQPCTLADIRKHFRKFLVVKDPDGKELYFRFYDPRVLPGFLESASPDELLDFFGPIQAFAAVAAGKLKVIQRSV